MIEIKYVSKYTDFLEVQKSMNEKAKITIVDRFAGIVAVITGITIIILYNGPLGIVFGCIILIIGVNWLFQIFHLSYVFSRIMFKNDPTNLSTKKILFDDEGMIYEINNLESKIGWSFYNSYFETKNNFVLVYGKKQVSIIPKSAFSDNDRIIFLNILKKKYIK